MKIELWELLSNWQLSQIEELEPTFYRAKLITWDTKKIDDYYQKTLAPSIEEFYKNFIFQTLGTEYTIAVQDEKTIEILKDAYVKFWDNMHIDLYELLPEFREKEEYFYYCNSLFTLLRLEYQKSIHTEWFWTFDISTKPQSYFAECKLTIVDTKLFMESQKKSLVTVNHETLVPENYSITIEMLSRSELRINDQVITLSKREQEYFAVTTLDELYNNTISYGEFARRHENILSLSWISNEKRETMETRVKNAFDEINKKINAHKNIRKEKIFLLENRQVSLNPKYEFELP